MKPSRLGDQGWSYYPEHLDGNYKNSSSFESQEKY